METSRRWSPVLHLVELLPGLPHRHQRPSRQWRVARATAFCARVFIMTVGIGADGCRTRSIHANSAPFPRPADDADRLSAFVAVFAHRHLRAPWRGAPPTVLEARLQISRPRQRFRGMKCALPGSGFPSAAGRG